MSKSEIDRIKTAAAKLESWRIVGLPAEAAGLEPWLPPAEQRRQKIRAELASLAASWPTPGDCAHA